MIKKKKLKRGDLIGDALFSRLIEEILSGKLPVGQILREAHLAREWNVSRTPMREAIRRASEAGFVVLRANHAPKIRALDQKDITHLYELRELLELEAFRLAWKSIQPEELLRLREKAEEARPDVSRLWPERCRQFDLAFHSLWMDRCGNPWLIADLRRHFQYLRIFQAWVGRDLQMLREAYEQHCAILDAMEKDKEAEAKKLLQEHIRISAALVQQALANNNKSIK